MQNLAGIFADVLGKPSIKLEESYTARDVPGWDSLAHINIVLAIEEAFGLKFRAAQIAKLKNIGDLVDVIIAQTDV